MGIQETSRRIAWALALVCLFGGELHAQANAGRRLTPVSGQPYLVETVIGAGTLYWTNGPLDRSKLSLNLSVLNSGATYQMFLVAGILCAAPFNVVEAVRSPKGQWVNNVAMRCRSSAAMIEVKATAAQYLGAIATDVAAPTISCTFDYGIDRGCGIWNAENQETICFKAGDPQPGNPGFSYVPATYDSGGPPYLFGPTKGNPLIRLRILSGIPMRSVLVTYSQTYFLLSRHKFPAAYWFGIGNDSVSEPCTKPQFVNLDTIDATLGSSQTSECVVPPFRGIKTFTGLEGQRGGASAFWGEVNQLLKACVLY